MNKHFLRDAAEVADSIDSIKHMFRGKKILITGATGMIGVQLINTLILLNKNDDLEISILAVIRNEEKFHNLFSEESCKYIQIIKHDFSKMATFPNVEVDYIIHGAAVTGNSKNHIEFPMNTINTSLISIQQLLELAKKVQCSGMVFLSSLEVYGTTDKKHKYVSENDYGYIDILNVRSSYAESKRMCENICVSYAHQYHVPVVIARLTASFGAGVRYSDNRVFAQFSKSIIEQKDIVLRTTGQTVRNYIYVSDVASAIFYLLIKGSSGQAYNVANMEAEISIKEMAERIIQLHPEAQIQLIFDLSEDIKNFGYNETLIKCLDTQKIQELGWKAKIGIDEMLLRLVAYMHDARSEQKGIDS